MANVFEYSIRWVFGVCLLNTELLIVFFSQYLSRSHAYHFSQQSVLKILPAFRWPILPLPAVVPKLSSGKATSLCCHLMKGGQASPETYLKWGRERKNCQNKNMTHRRRAEKISDWLINAYLKLALLCFVYSSWWYIFPSWGGHRMNHMYIYIFTFAFTEQHAEECAYIRYIENCIYLYVW